MDDTQYMPCPFCGRKPYINFRLDDPFFRIDLYCDICGVHLARDVRYKTFCQDNPGYKFIQAENEIRKIWNARAEGVKQDD